MPRGSSKSTVAIQRLLEERRQYEAWIARLDAAADATPENVRLRVKTDYRARLAAVNDELKAHAESARQLMAQRRDFLLELQKKEAQSAERLTETELRHAVGEYDEGQWTQVHKDTLAELLSVRQEMQSVEADLEKLEELDRLVHAKPGGTPSRVASPPRMPARPEETKRAPVDELAFLKSVTEEDKGSGGLSPRRASGAQFQPAIPQATPPPSPSPSPSSRPARNPGPTPKPILPSKPVLPSASADDDPEAEKTLKCLECGTMNPPTEWYCEHCGAELAAL